jgi:antirestriction protein ArdC
MTAQERRAEALTRACTGQTLSNYPAIFQGFLARGIPESDIRPRENVFTYEAWKALGRHVRKGQQGVKVVTFITTESGKTEEPQTETLDGMEAQPKKSARHSRPWTTTVFHISQTEPDEPRGTRDHALPANVTENPDSQWLAVSA